MLLALALAGEVFFRVGSVDLTPPERLPLGGYTERNGALFEEGGDRLWARVICLEESDLRVAVVSIESLTVPEGLAEAVRSRIPPTVRMFLTATHTHSAPDSQMLNPRMTLSVPGIASYRPRWLEWYADRIAMGIRSTLGSEPKRLEGAKLAEFSPHLNKGRRSGAKPDPRAFVVRHEGRALFGWYSAHATLLEPENLQLSGDWPGAVSARLGAPMLIGPIGDVAPSIKAEDSGRRVSAFADHWAQGAKKTVGACLDLAGGLDFHEEPVHLATPVPHPEFASAYRVPQILAQGAVTKFAPAEARLTFLRVGKLLLVGFPGEPSSAVGQRLSTIAKKAGLRTALTVSHVNGWVGYVLEPEDYDRGGYEATLSFHGREASERFVEAMARGLKQLGRPSYRAGLPERGHTSLQPGNAARSWFGQSL